MGSEVSIADGNSRPRRGLSQRRWRKRVCRIRTTVWADFLAPTPRFRHSKPCMGDFSRQGRCHRACLRLWVESLVVRVRKRGSTLFWV
jgi:hypothetical protein